MKTSASKTATITAAAILFTVSAAASLNTSNQLNTTQVQPGEETVLGNITVTAEGQNHGSITVDTSDTPFSLSGNPSSFGLQQGETRNVSFTADAASDFPAGEYDIQLGFDTGSQVYNQSLNLSVVEDYGFNTSKQNITRNISVGTQGQLGNTSVFLTGNVDQQTINTELKGNLSEYLATPSSFQVYSYDNYTLAPTYQVGASVPRGFYNATLTLDGENMRRNVTLQSRFVDETPPVIESTTFPDIMATQAKNFSVTVRDNLNVSTVTGEVVTPDTRVVNNETVSYNRSVENITFTQRSQGSQVYTHSFDNTETRGRYYVEVTATDSSNNSANTTASFQIKRLNTTQLLESNFRMDAVEPGDKAEKTFLKITEKTPVTLQLQNFSHDKSPNSSISVGIRKPGDEVAEEFGNLSKPTQINVDEPGEYTLVVESDTDGDDYEGQIKVTPPKQHFNLSTVRFEGNVINPEYPEPGNFTLNEFSGTIFYDSPDDTEKNRVILNLSTSAERCKGFDTFKECFGNDYSLGEIPELKQRNTELQNKAEDWRNLGISFIVISVLTVAAYIRTQNLGYKIPTINYS